MSAQVHAVVLAGGSGERFWPASTPEAPKPFARLFGGQSLLQDTLDRAARFTSPERMWVVAGTAHATRLRAHVEGRVPPDHVLLEPARRDTGPAVALAAAVIGREAPDAILVVLPSDHHVPDPGEFAETVHRALAAAARGFITCVGIAPTRPDPRYGYILAGQAEVAPGVAVAERFIEKPPADVAEQLLASGSALWNAGILVARVDVLREALQTWAPDLAAALPQLEEAGGEHLRSVYPELPAISIDYAVLQRADNVAVAPGRFRWHDVGAWAELPRVRQDADGNFVHGPATLIGTRDSVVYNTAHHPVVVHGMEGVLVAHCSDHVTLVAPLHADGRGLLRTLEAAGGTPRPEPFQRFLAAAGRTRTIDKPWGCEIVWADTDRYLAKVICVRAGESLSRQYHLKKTETHWYLAGSGVLEHGGATHRIEPGLLVTIAPGEVHRVHAETDTCFLEASTPHPDDLVRLDDRYGRTHGG